MAYKTILTVVSNAAKAAHLDAAIAVAQREEAHLDILCLGIDHTQTGYFYAGASTYMFQQVVDRVMEEITALQETLRARLASENIRWSVDSAVAQVGGISALIGMRARFADLTVLPQPYGEDVAADAEAVIEAAMFEGGCPVLVIPPSGLPENFSHRILIGWNQSNEALVAVRQALPLLIRAEAVEIAAVDPSPNSPERSEPGQALCRMLTRHSVKAEIAVLARTLPRISEILNHRAIETGATMIVMGAYGHSRFREAILGGATRNMLEQAKVPVLMAR